NNLDVLLPVFATVMRAVRGVYEDLETSTKDFVDESLISIYDTRSHLLSVELNLSYFIQAISSRHSSRKEEILVELYDKMPNPLLRRQIILTMARWKRFYWLTDIKNKYAGLSEWEKRAFLVASYVLGDEGKYWRQNTKHTWSPMDALVRNWISKKYPESGMIPR